VNNGGNVRAEPDADARIVGAIQLGDTVEVLEKNQASTWYRIETSSGVNGWTSVLALRPAADVVARTPIEGGIMPTPPISTPTFDLTTGVLVPVFHGGNVRSEPSLNSRLILDQVYTGETVELLARTSNGIWYQVKNPREQVGWVHTTLLRVPQDVAAQVPDDGLTMPDTEGDAADSGGDSDLEGSDNLALGLPSVEQGSVEIGGEASATLDTIFEAHDWTFEGESGQVVTISAAAAAGSSVDPRLNLLGPNGEWLIANDDGGSGTDALIENYTLPENGTYTIKIDVFEGGEYILSVE
jgi:SH3-like domain-containing protein